MNGNDLDAYEAGSAALVFRDVIVAEGSDAAKFLHAIVSQSITDMVDAETRWSFLLTPQGRVVSLFRVSRLAPDRFELDTDSGAGSALHAAMSRYLIRTKCTLVLNEQVPVARSAVNVEGRPNHPILGGSDVFGPHESLLGADVADHARIAAGFPALGTEIDESTIPNSTGLLASAVNFGKGCYIGQELVERIDSRGASSPVRLVRLSLIDAGAAERSSTIRVTSVSKDPRSGAVLGIGFAQRSVAAGDSAAVEWRGESVLCRVIDDVGAAGPAE